MALFGLGTLWQVAQRIERLFDIERRHGEMLDRIVERIAVLEDRLTRVEMRDDINAAKAAAAASSAVAVSISDLARRLGALEERSRAIDYRGET